MSGLPPFLFDGHTDVPTRLWETPCDLRAACPDRQVDLPRLRAGGVSGLVFAFFLPSHLSAEEGLAHAETMHELTVAQLAPGALELATTPAALDAAVARGAVGVVFGLENGRPLILPGALEQLLAMGVRLVTLTHMGSHEWCDSSTDDEVHGGLSPAGEDIVRALNRAGVLVDVSHVSDRAVEHVLTVSSAPVIASHSSARALCDHPRNLRDDLARAISRRGGVVMVNAFPVFLDPVAESANRTRMAHLREPMLALEEAYAGRPGDLAAARVQLLAPYPQPPVPLSTFADHVMHLLGVAGEEGLGIGTDFDGIPETPVGLTSPADFPALMAELRARGLDERTLRLVMGDNFRRVWRAVAAGGD
ncbi:MAG TPA: dipeptidase [Thermoanaerobaculia bacterium]|jgi:membrane dipeptidase|nr:dipeptidase [Thermoanaerobaculia bacterium]